MKIGFISTRFAGTDGVSLESAKLAHVLQRLGHESFYCAGELDPALPGLQATPLHFKDEVAEALGRRAFGRREPDPRILQAIAKRAQELKEPLRRFLDGYEIDYVIAQNIFSIPMQLPLAQALTELLRERQLPALAHNHDLYWERERFVVNCIGEFLDTYFPPDLPTLRQATINSLAQAELKRRRDLDSTVIPNVFDFDTPAPGVDDYNVHFRQAIDLGDDDWLILQPTRVIPRKGIELAVELVAGLDDPRAKLIISHEAGDEGMDYWRRLQELARERGVDMRLVADCIDDQRRVAEDGSKVYSLWDAYPHANLVTYPSLIEGFGNALLETVYFRQPALVNRYDVYVADIAPLGFRFVEIDGVVTPEAVAAVRRWLENPAAARPIVEHNFALAREHFSYQTLERILHRLIGPA